MCLAASYWARIERIFYALTRTDAEGLGFSDARLYDEISKPHHERRIEIRPCGRSQALELLGLWLHKTDKTEY